MASGLDSIIIFCVILVLTIVLMVWAWFTAPDEGPIEKVTSKKGETNDGFVDSKSEIPEIEAIPEIIIAKTYIDRSLPLK